MEIHPDIDIPMDEVDGSNAFYQEQEHSEKWQDLGLERFLD